MIDLQKDRKIAEAANNGEWFIKSEINSSDEWNRSDVMTEDKWIICFPNKRREAYDHIGRHIKQFQPSHALELINELEAARERISILEGGLLSVQAATSYRHAWDIAKQVLSNHNTQPDKVDINEQGEE